MEEWAIDYKRVISEVIKAIDGHVQIKMAVPSDSILSIPGRKIVFVDGMSLNWSGGGIHCST